MNEEQYNALKSKLRVGIQWNTEVTLNDRKNIVNQVYCSALPVAYSRIEDSLWEKFARLILEATYEATFYAALINYQKTGNNKLFLTLVGGGAFGNKKEWIIDAIRNSINKFINTPLDIMIVSYGRSKWEVVELLNGFS
jgi:lipoprotein signal peptidase